MSRAVCFVSCAFSGFEKGYLIFRQEDGLNVKQVDRSYKEKKRYPSITTTLRETEGAFV